MAPHDLLKWASPWILSVWRSSTEERLKHLLHMCHTSDPQQKSSMIMKPFSGWYHSPHPVSSTLWKSAPKVLRTPLGNHSYKTVRIFLCTSWHIENTPWISLYDKWPTLELSDHWQECSFSLMVFIYLFSNGVSNQIVYSTVHENAMKYTLLKIVVYF